MSPAQQARMAEIREIGQKMRDVNDIFTTGQKMDDKVLVASARQKLAQLAKQKHDLETQPVAEGKKDRIGEEGTYTLVFSSDQKPYSWGKFFAKSKEEAKQKAKDIFKKHNFTNVNVRELAIKESIEEGFDGINATPVSGPGARANDQVAETFADQGSGSGATGAEDGNEVTRRFGVTVVDPNSTSVSQRKEKIQKVVRIRGGEEVDAENRAVEYYKRKGYKVIDAWFIDEVDALGEVTADYEKTATWPGVEKKSVKEANDGVDTIEMDVELFIRCLEWAKESAPDDVALHKFTENVVAKDGILTMDDYESLVPAGEVKEGILGRRASRSFSGTYSKKYYQEKKKEVQKKEEEKKESVKEDKYEDEDAKYVNIERIANKRARELEAEGNSVYMINSFTDARTKQMKAELLFTRKDGSKDKEVVTEDASAGASSSASVAVAVSGTPGLIKRTGSGKKKGRYGNSVSPKTFSAVGKGIYEAEINKSMIESYMPIVVTGSSGGDTVQKRDQTGHLYNIPSNLVGQFDNMDHNSREFWSIFAQYKIL